MKKWIIAGIIILAIVLTGIGAVFAAQVHTTIITNGDVTVVEPLNVTGALEPLTKEKYLPGETVTTGVYTIMNGSDTLYYASFYVDFISPIGTRPYFSVEKIVGETKYEAWQNVPIAPGAAVVINVRIFFPLDSSAGVASQPKLVVERALPPSSNYGGKGG